MPLLLFRRLLQNDRMEFFEPDVEERKNEYCKKNYLMIFFPIEARKLLDMFALELLETFNGTTATKRDSGVDLQP